MTTDVSRAIQRVITDIDELADPHVGARTAPMTLRPGPIRAELTQANLGAVVVEVCDYSFAVATRGETVGDRISVLAPLRPATSGHMNGAAFAPGLLHVFGERAEVAGASAGPLLFTIVSFDRSLLVRAAGSLGVDLDAPGRGESRTAPSVDRFVLCDVVDLVRRSAVSGGAVAPQAEMAHIADLLMELVVRSLQPERDAINLHRHTRGNSVRIARECEGYAASRRYQDVTLVDLCRVSGASERRVRQAFHDCYGMSPTGYLRVAALHEVRAALLDGPPARDAVSRTASDFGFWHLGRFAGTYRTLFGESPRTTVSRRREARWRRAEAG